MNSNVQDGNFAHGDLGLGRGTAIGAAGVASLDTSLIQQTKSEIRSLTAEIAQLAHAPIEPEEFYEGFLPRLCVAMGATAAAIWRFAPRSRQESLLVAEHALPSELVSERRPTDAHRKILDSVAAEGQPILVPPGGVKVDAQRPVNPLSESLIAVPVRVQEDVEYILEVVQRPSGGPAAQRGYLRFVAQMADLMADYLRRRQLLELSEDRVYVDRIEQWLTEIATQEGAKLRSQSACEALLDLLSGDQVVLLTGRPPKVLALSGVRTFDPRSEIVLAAQNLASRISGAPDAGRPEQEDATVRRYAATDRRESSVEAADDSADQAGSIPAAVDQLCELLGCRSVSSIVLEPATQTVALIAYAGPEVTTAQTDSRQADRAERLARAIGSLLVSGQAFGSAWRRWIPGARPRAVPLTNRGQRQVVQSWIMRAALLGLVIAITMFPVTQQISATATLHPLSKQPYYAPMSGIVSEVLVSEGETVQAGQSLVRLTNRQLEAQIDQLTGEQRITQDRLAQLVNARNRGSDLTARENDRIEGEIEQLRISSKAIQQQLQIQLQQQRELTVVASAPGQVASWDLKNRLMNRPVSAGDQLVATFIPDGFWRLQITIPDYRSGLVNEAIERSDKGARVRFALSSHPDQIREGIVRRMASQVTSAGEHSPSKIVYADAVIESDALPLKKDGAIARATIDCGRVPAGWLVLRDAYWAVSSRLRMLW